MKQLAIWFGVLIATMLLAYWLAQGGLKVNQNIISSSQMKVGGKTLNIEVADTKEKLERGLSGREKLAENEGMLFVMPQDSQPGFWMKEMKFSIDIIWINDNKVVEVSENLPVPNGENSSDNLLKYYPKQPVDYVLEVNTGFVKENNIKPGIAIKLPPNLE